jgi:hypothetical protein
MLLVWIAAGALTWFGASICAELTSAFRAPAVSVFLREMFSPAAGFLWGWAMFWSMHSGIIAAIAMVFARYAATIVPMGDAGIRLTAIAGILGLSAINYVGVRPGSAVQTGLTITKIGAIAVLLGLLFGMGTLHAPLAAGELHAPGFFARSSRAVRVRRVAHGDLRSRRNARPGAHDPTRADARHGDCSDHLSDAERRLFAGPAVRPGPGLHAYRLRRDVGGRRSGRRIRDLDAGDRVVARRDERHHSRRAARVLCDG